MAKKQLFLAALFPIEIRTLSRIISLKCAELFLLTPDCGCAEAYPGGQAGKRLDPHIKHVGTRLWIWSLII